MIINSIITFPIFFFLQFHNNIIIHYQKAEGGREGGREGGEREQACHFITLPGVAVSKNFITVSRSLQHLQILMMSGVSSASQILELFWNIWSQVSDFPVHGPGMYTLS